MVSTIQRTKLSKVLTVKGRNPSFHCVHPIVSVIRMSISKDQVAAILSTPALVAPPGVTPNFIEPPNQNGLAWFVTTICMVVATLCVFLRGYAKVWLARKVETEEILMVLAYVRNASPFQVLHLILEPRVPTGALRTPDTR